MKTILVIEDNPEVRENLVEILTLAQYRVLEAANGKRGVELARQNTPDLILCDIMMPELDGYGVLHIIGKDPATASIPFIFLTAKADAADFRSGMNLGADDYLTKPFDDIALLNAVELRLRKGDQTRVQQHVDGLALLLGAVNVPADGAPAGGTYPTVHYRKKQVLYSEGNFPSSLYFLRKGQAKTYRTDLLGNQLITSLVGAGDFVGYIALLQQTTHQESAELLDDADVCTIPKADFFALIDHNADVAGYFLRLLADDIVYREKRLMTLAYQSVRQRVAGALLMVQQKFQPPPDGSATYLRPPALSLSRENWSQLVGASTETVIRTLSDLRAEGLIELTGGEITILNAEKLARLKR